MSKLTREKFDELLLAYGRAMDELHDTAQHGTSADHAIAMKAAEAAYEALIKAVFP